MRKIMSFALVLVLLITCSSYPTHAVVPGQDAMNPAIIPDMTNTDELFRLRAELLMDPNATQEQFDRIDAQLLALGAEPISSYEVAKKFGETAQPLYDAVSTSDTEWISQRFVNVYCGKEYDIQIITGQMRNQNATSSPLYSYKNGEIRKYSGKKIGNVKAIQVLADEVTSATASCVPVIGPILSSAITFYDILHAYNDGLSPTSVVDDAECSFDICAISTMRFAFIKYRGNLDEGNQILGYCGTQVDYAVSITFPYVDENLKPHLETKEYSDTATSYGFNNEAVVAIASKNFFYYKFGQTILDTHYILYTIPIVLLDTTYKMEVPYAHP